MKSFLALIALIFSLFLLGCATSPSPLDIQELSSLTKVLSDTQKVKFDRAMNDFRRADANKVPQYSTLKWALLDGGTCIYEGDGYSLTSHNGAFANEGNVQGRLAGATMTLQRAITGDSAKIVSTKRFVPNPK